MTTFSLPVSGVSLVLVLFASTFGCSSTDIAESPIDSSTQDMGMDSSTQEIGRDGPPETDANPGDASIRDVDQVDTDVSLEEDQSPSVPTVFPPDPRNPDGDELLECECPNPEDACTVSAQCAKSDRFCDDDSECPMGYACNEDRYCVCEGVYPLCSALCEFDEQCPFIWGCLDSGRCSGVNRGCDNALHCPIGQVCHSVVLGPNNEREICDTPGPVPAVDDCETGYECASGRCVDDVCATPCVRNGDCPDDVGCNQYRGICEGPRRGNCGDDAYVWRFDLCVSQFCSHSADCGPQTDCVTSSSDNELGYCLEESSENPCKPGEVAISPLPIPRFPDLCWSMSKQGCTPGSCNEPYYCLRDHNFSNLRPQCVRER